MRFDASVAAELPRFGRSRRRNTLSIRNVPSEIGRVRFAADRAHTAPCARVYKRTAGGGVTHV